MTNEELAIPEVVLEALEAIRAKGLYNMFERNSVIAWIVHEEAEGEGKVWPGAGGWLYDHDKPSEYIAALNAMGRRRANRRDREAHERE